MSRESANVTAFIAGMILGVVSNMIPSLPETRRIYADKDQAGILAVRDSWLIVAVIGSVCVGLMLAAGWHRRGYLK